MKGRHRKKIRIAWIVITLLAVLSMVAFTVAPLINNF
ncbi:MAG: hypothetical protein UX02_C0002G0322 [Candidatus Moranbacteria bacterium GW2011_GWC1_45_18]|nr:MAG: hypothetical protein UT79_C0001G0139 [Candidatus Moranbacteria bacterium GW2011_GWC2_40_12]KKT33725.1 MAG: hypothetical protein UW19_C0006G0027 [Candidatus Moranbacteria bacterium GW2011_GWF2_44_10]KKU00079.1 MAG: hypothetical protein UX02_C0002G0322 [Candidatus Moranbacteria bacterium GW2011_GWC1_45_18]